MNLSKYLREAKAANIHMLMQWDNSWGEISRMSFKRHSKGEWKIYLKPGYPLYIFSGLRLYSILFRFRICKFKKGGSACVADRIQLDNVLPWVDRDFTRNFSSIAAQLSWQIYKSRRSVFLKVSFSFFFFCFEYKSFSLQPHPHAWTVFIWQMLFCGSNNKETLDGFLFLFILQVHMLG